MQWERDKAAEGLMHSLGIKYEYRMGIPCANLDIKKSRALNARFGESIDNAMSFRFESAMRSGAIFPAIILAADNRILAGNHRIDAVTRIGATAIDAYVLDKDTTSEQIRKLAYMDNNRHGTNLNEAQIIQGIIQIHREFPDTNSSITALNKAFFGGNPETYDKILSAKHAKDVEEQLQGLGVDTGKIEPYRLCSIYQFRTNNNIIREMGLALARNKSLPVNDLIKACKEGMTEQQQLDAIKQFSQAQLDKAKGRKDPYATVIKKHITSLLNYIESNNLKCFDDLNITNSDEAKKAKEMFDKLINVARDMKKNRK